MATYIWVGIGSSGSWSSPADWANPAIPPPNETPAGPPGSGDFAVVETAVTITGSGAADTVLFGANDTLTGMLTAGTLAAPAGAGEFSLTVSGSGASINVTSNLNIGAGSLLDVNGGTVTGPSAGAVGFQDFGTVSVDGGGSIDGGQLNSFGSLLVENGNVTVQTLEVGAFEGTPGSLDLAAGSSISDTIAILGITSADVTNVTITGADWTSKSLSVGASGQVTLTVSAGASVDASGGAGFFPGQPSLLVGGAGGSTGHVTIDGSQLSAGSDAWLGAMGTADVTLSSGGSLEVTGTFDAGTEATGVGRVDIADGQLTISGNATIGDAGSAAVSIAADGSLSIGGTLDIAVQAKATGTLTLLGHGKVSGDLFVGDTGLAQLTLSDGGMLDVSGNFDAGALIDGGASIEITGANSSLQVGQNATIGDAGDVSLDLAAGATLTTAVLDVGAAKTGAGSITIAGGASLTTSGDAKLGDAGAANLAISASGSVTVGGSLDAAAASGSTATIDVSGSDAVLAAGGDATFGDGGTATASVGDTGSITVAGVLALGLAKTGQGTLAVAGGSVNVTGDMHLGDAGTGDVTLGANGTLSVGGTLSEGLQAGSGGSLMVTDASAQLTLSADWIIGVAGTHDDTISAAASISLAGALSLGSLATGDGALTLDGGASLAVGQGFVLGDAGSGSLELDGGSTLSTAGTLALGAQTGSDGTLTLSGSSDLAPGADVTVGGAGSGSIDIGQGSTFSPSGALALGSAAKGDGAITLGQDVTLTPGGDLTVGGAGNGSVDVAAGATLDGSAGAFVVGGASGGHGTISLSGTAAEAKAADLVVGGGGGGVVSVAADTTLSASGDVTLGQTAGSTGTITVAATGDLEAGGDLVVGAAGAGSLDVNAGSLTVSGAFTIADAKGSSGDVTFGNATLSLGTLTVGNAGAGTFSANTSANVTATEIVLGSAASGSGTFNLDGTGSQVQAGSLLVGDDGTGALQVTNSAALQVSGVASMGQGSGLTPQGATIEANASWTIGGALQVGEASSAGLTIDTGGQVAAASVVLGDQKGASGTIQATGSATLASSLGFGTLLEVGNFGTGALMLAKGAQAGTGTTGTVEIAAGTKSVGGVTLSDAGTELQAQLLAVGGSATAAGGAGTLSIGTGAQVVAAAATVWAGGVVALAGGTLTTDPITVLGNITGFGSLGGTVTDTGRISATGGTLAVTGNVAGTGTLAVAPGAELWLQAGAAASAKISLAASGAKLRLGALAATHAAVTGFAVGDTLLVDGVTADGGTLSGGTLTLTHGGAPVGTLALSGLASGTRFSISTVGGEATIVEAPCFAAGTRILTEHGEIPVEQLRVGQRVRTRRGECRPIAWLGHRRVACARHPRPHDVMPVRVQRGAFGPGVPARDLLLSPDHAVFCGGALIPVRYLVNGATIRQEAAASITYWHVELDRHDVLLAEGLPCESYLDTGNRAAFANGAGPLHLHPDFSRAVWQAQGCAKLVLDGARVAAARRRLLRRAETLGYALTADSGLSLEVDGETLATARGRRWHVLLPQGTREVRLRSRTWVPCHTRTLESDARHLGVAIAGIALDGHPIPLDDVRLCAGWHAPEPDWRWTDGDARIRTEGVFRIEFDLVMNGTYWRDLEKAA